MFGVSSKNTFTKRVCMRREAISKRLEKSGILSDEA